MAKGKAEDSVAAAWIKAVLMREGARLYLPPLLHWAPQPELGKDAEEDAEAIWHFKT